MEGKCEKRLEKAVVKFGFCEFCNRFGKVATVEGLTGCKQCFDVFEMVLSAYVQEA